MPRQPAVPPTREPAGGSYGEYSYVESHPAFATIMVSHTHGGNVACFGSRARHCDYVTLSISRATRTRSLHTDWIHGSRKELIEVRMTHAQFVEMVARPNSGSGSPCTLQWFDGPVPEYDEEENTHGVYEQEIREKLARMQKQVLELTREVRAAADAGKMPNKTRDAILARVATLEAFIPHSVGFMRTVLQEDLEKQVERAKIEAEAALSQRIVSLGTKALGDDPEFRQRFESLLETEESRTKLIAPSNDKRTD